jgi:hypothetical protein
MKKIIFLGLFLFASICSANQISSHNGRNNGKFISFHKSAYSNFHRMASRLNYGIDFQYNPIKNYNRYKHRNAYFHNFMTEYQYQRKKNRFY